jgi:hypothetical protein
LGRQSAWAMLGESERVTELREPFGSWVRLAGLVWVVR